MTLNCELGLDAAVEHFEILPSDPTAADLLDSAIEYWRKDLIDDKACAQHLRKVADYLAAKLSPKLTADGKPATFDEDVDHIIERMRASLTPQEQG